jgi:hypothetical protein
MKLKDAIFEMEPGDKFKPIQCSMLVMDDGLGIINTSTGKRLKVCQLTLDYEGEIIRAEPEVLIYDEWCNKNPGYIPDRLESYEMGDKNGQLKEWKRLKPFIEYCKETIEQFNSDGYGYLVDFIERIKPPYEQ